jgi:hypothetical protein
MKPFYFLLLSYLDLITRSPADLGASVPTAAEFGDAIGEAFAKSKFLFELLLDIAGNDLVLAQTFDDFLIERGEFSDLFLQHFLDVFFAAIANIVEANESGAIPFRMALLDAVEQ